MTTKPFESYLSGEYLANNPTWDEEDSDWKADQILKLVRRNNLSPASVVEIGCGAGGILACLQESLPDIRYSGFEIANDASRFWDKYAGRNIEFTVGDFLQHKNEHYDMLLLMDVIEHVPDPFEFLKNLISHADHFVFHIPLDLSALSVIREKPLLNVRSKVGHIHYFTKGLALSLLLECGFEIIDWFYTGACFTSPQITWKTKLAGIPRRFFYSLNRDWGVRVMGGDTLMVLAQPKT